MTKKQMGRPIDRSKDRAILRAASALLFSQGPQAVTMEAVADRAGISKATLYARHADRDQLLRAVIEAESFVMTRSLGKSPRTQDELSTALVTFLTGLSTFLASKRHQRLMQAIVFSSQAITGARKTIYQNGPQRTHQVLSAYLESAAAQGLLQCAHPDQSAELLLGMMMGLDLVRTAYGMAAPRRQREDRERHMRLIVHDFLTLHWVTLQASVLGTR
jgi:TetR/AcrR family transcriptional repressor of mexJK operon